MRTSPVLVVSLLGAVLVLMGIGTVVILRIQARQDRIRARTTRTLEPHRRRIVSQVSQATSGVGMTQATDGVGLLLGRLFGFDQNLSAHYPLRWWMALLVTLAIAIASARVGRGLAGDMIWLAAPVEWVILSRFFFSWCERRRRDQLFKQFPDALAMIVRAVRVGIPVIDSIRAVGRELEAPTGPEFARLSHELAIGNTLQDALRALAERNGLQEYRFFATALSLQSQTGGGLSETLDNLADVIRKRVAVRQKGQALAAEAKMSSLVLASLPPLAALGLWLMNGAYIMLLFTDPLGQKILGVAVLTLALGIFMMNMLIRKSLS